MPVMIDLLKMLRPANMLLIAFMLLAIKYGFLEPSGVETALDPLHFSLLLIATLFIAGAGNLINDIEDQQIDTINRPDRPLAAGRLSTKTAFNAYLILTFTGVGIGFYLSNYVGFPGLTIVFIGVAALLYFYSNQLSQMIIGNISIALLIGVCVLLPVLFDIFPAILPHGISLSQQQATKVLLYFAGYAAYVNLVRELVKDIVDVDGDHAAGRNTVPISMGRDRSRILALWMMILILLLTLAFAYLMDGSLQALAFYLLFALGGSMLFICLQLYHAKRAKDYHFITKLLKVLMFLGLLALVLFPNQLMLL